MSNHVIVLFYASRIRDASPKTSNNVLLQFPITKAIRLHQFEIYTILLVINFENTK